MKQLVTVFVMFLWTLGAYSQYSTEHQALLKEANEAFENKEYVEAYPKFSQLVSLYPKDAELNYKFGTCCIYSSTDNEQAIRHLDFSIKKGAPVDAQYFLGVAYHLNYEFSKAIESYEAFNRKADSKQIALYNAARQIEMCKSGKGLLAGMVDLVVLDKKETSEADFFRYFNLEGIGGKLLTVPTELQTKLDVKKGHTGVIHFPVGSNVIYFSSYGKKGSTGKDIYRASVMPDGSFSQIETVLGDINTGYDEDYPYMHPDGKTIYFASTGHNSMGGYDIFRSQIDPATGSFGPAVNMDFAINTPGDDILYVADSLNQSAYFASGRSSSQGNLHVYKVMVKGIPLHLIFLKGEFFSQFDQQAKSARILVKDELTGKPVTELRTDDMNGEYIISFPKPGLYSFEVETDHSPIIHQGMVEIPIVDESTAFRQELHLVDVNGQEKLVIHNFFDEALNVDLASLSGEMLRNKAGLEVNVTDDLLSQLESPKSSIESAEKATLAAGFGKEDSVESIVAQANDFADNLDEESAKLKSKSGQAFRRAEELQRKAASKAQEAEGYMHDVNQDDQEAYVLALRDYVDALNEAKDLSNEARVAYETGAECIALADSSSTSASKIRLNNQSIQEATGFEDFDLAVEGLRWERDRQISLAQDKDDLDANLVSLANLKEGDQKHLLQKISNLRADEDDLERKIKVNEQALANDPKKKEIAQFEENIKQANQELNGVKQEIIFETAKVEGLGRDEVRLRQEANLLMDLTAGGQLLSNYKEGELGKDEQEKLRAGITGTETKIAILAIDDAETLALLGDEQRVTRNDISRLPAMASTEVELGMELKSLKNVRSDYEAKQIELVEIDPVSDNFRSVAIAQMTIKEIDQQEVLLKTVRGRLVDPQEIQQVDEELTALSDFRTSVESDKNELDAIEAIEISEDGMKAAIAQVMPEYNQSIQKANNADGTEMSRLQEKNRVREDLNARCEEEISVNENALLASSSAEDIARFSMRNRELNKVIQQVEDQILDLQLVKAAYELDNIAVIESDQNSGQKLQRQIELTKEYMATLDNEVLKQNSQWSDKLNDKRLVQLNQELDQASIKMAAYQSDLDLTVAAENSPSSNDELASEITEEEPTTNTIIDETLVAENVKADNSSVELAAIPQNVGSLIVLLDSEYQENWNKADTEMSDPVERSQTKINMNKKLINSAQQEIRNRALAMDNSEDSSKMDQWQMDIQLLEKLVEQKSDEIDNLNSVIDENTEEWAGQPVGEQEFNPADGFDGNTLYTESGSEYVKEMLSTTLRNNVRAAYKTDGYTDLISTYGNDENEIKNQEKINTLETEITGLELQIDSAEKDSEKNKLDRKTEKLYQQLADEDIRNAPKLDAMTSLKYDENSDRITDLKRSSSEKLASNEYLAKRVERLLEEVDYEFEEADNTREEAAPEIDEIKQSFMYREAFTREMAAIRNQEKTIEILENIDALSLYSDEDLATVMRGEAVIATSANEDTAAIDENEDMAIEDAPADIALSDEESSFLDAALVQFSAGIDKKQVREADVLTRTAMEEMLLAEYTLNTSQVNEVVEDERWGEYLGEAEVLTTKNNTYNDRLKQRKSMLDQLSVLEADLDKWATMARNTEDPAEREGLLAEMRKTYAVAQVLYEDVQALDKELEADEAELAQLNAQLNATYNKVEIEEEVKSIAKNMTAAAALADNSPVNTNETRAVEVESEDRSSNVSNDSSDTADNLNASPIPKSAPSAGNPGIPRTAEEFRSFAYPEVLTSEIYARMDDAVYSDDNPIPLDIALPEGIVYKVQVGAFRNEIPQSHFAEFAPIMGETVGTGITRYTVGLFKGFTSADLAKAEIRGLGYRDAFVVAFRNGVRIPLYEAREVTGEELVVSTEGPRALETPKATNSKAAPGQSVNSEGSSSAQPLVGNTPAVSPNNSSVAVSNEALDEYYDNNPGVAKATRVENLEGLFFTVQVGVYSKPVSSKELFSVSPLNSELTQVGKVRYTTGIYNNIIAASVRKDEIRQLGIQDAFVTAYHNGKRISIQEASDVLRSGGANVLQITEANNGSELAKQPTEEFDVFLGTFENEVPSSVAKAMLFLEDKYGILQKKNGNASSYFTARVSTMQKAKEIQAAFGEYDVSTQIRTYKKGVETKTE
jgi:epidermal growth factor receptor substrate 15